MAFLHLGFLLSLEPGLDGVQSDVMWPFSSGKYKHKDFVKQWALNWCHMTFSYSLNL